MDKDKTLKVNWNEWREYHLLNPSGHSIHDIIQFWRHHTVSFGKIILLLLVINSADISCFLEYGQVLSYKGHCPAKVI